MKIHRFVLLFICYAMCAIVQQAKSYTPDPLIPLELWHQLEPYFLPEEHPIKRKLDRLFSNQRATLSEETFRKAGLGKVKKRKPTNIVFGQSPFLKGIVIKAFLDTQPPLPEWENWLKRIEGSRCIRQCIKRHHYKQFKVPHKWIYPLPAHPSPPLQYSHSRKYFILIAEDMDILNRKENLKAYRERMTKECLNQLYVILTEEGLIDSIYPDNVPFTKDGKLAFIDTEHYHKTPIKYHQLLHFLSPAMQNYWQQLIDQSGR